MDLILAAIAVLSLPLLLARRVYLLLPANNPAPPRPRGKGDTCSLGVFLGSGKSQISQGAVRLSGGHTAEMKTLLSSVDFSRYTPRVYACCRGDDMSIRALAEIEHESKGYAYTLLSLPRARQVFQSYPSAVLSALNSLRTAIWHAVLVPFVEHPRKPWVDVLLINGPGTCVILVAACWIRRILALPHTRIIYVESFARVNSLSLSGKILRHFVDTFVVQWPDAAGVGVAEGGSSEGADAGIRREAAGRQLERGKRGVVKYRGWLV